MALKLNDRAYRHAQKLIEDGKVERDEGEAWSGHRPSVKEQNEFIDAHGFGGYGRWYLGVDDDYDENAKAHFKFPYGDFQLAHRCGVLAAGSWAAKRDHPDIQAAAAHLLAMIDARPGA
jgi:hypothetical protein